MHPRRNNNQPPENRISSATTIRDIIKATLKTIPCDPGIYQMIDDHGEIIYIGKAKDLKKRVSSYFNKKHEDIKTTLMVASVRRIEVIVTATEKDAYILENQFIKTHKPKYNISLKDDKSYPYIKITTNEVFPRILIVREKKDKDGHYFGPFPSAGSTRQLQRMLYDMFPLRDCKQAIDLENKQPKCINLDIGRCLGPCVIKSVKPEYDKLVRELMMLLSGKNDELVAELRRDMEAFSAALQFEKAAVIRDRIRKIEALKERQHVLLDDQRNIHIWVTSENDDFYYALVQVFLDGKLLAQKGWYLEREETDDPAHFYEGTFLDYLSEVEERPREILCDNRYYGLISELIHRDEALSIKVKRPERGRKKELLDIAAKNARLALFKLLKDTLLRAGKNNVGLLDKMKEKLHLSRRPELMLGFDISHLQGTDIVASSVAFRDGRKYSEGYRHLRIRDVYDKSNDFLSIYEAVKRRLMSDMEKGFPLPQLILIDGGRGQLNFAYNALKELNLQGSIEMIALAKRFEKIYSLNTPNTIQLKLNDPVLQVLQQVRDESHRFALTYQRKQRLKSLESGLKSIKGLGDKRINLLYRSFKTIDGLRQASADDIAKVGRIGKTLAAQIKQAIQ